MISEKCIIILVNMYEKKIGYIHFVGGILIIVNDENQMMDIVRK